MVNVIYTYPAMQDFVCLGDRCEDTCCKSWDIRVDKHHYTLLQECVTHNASQKVLFDRYVKLIEEGDVKNYALVNLDEQGLCPFLDTQGWCDLHKHYGLNH